MKIAFGLMLAIGAFMSRAQGKLDGCSSMVTVSPPDAIYPNVNLYRAEGIASRMFAQAGVCIMWQSGRADSHLRRPPIVLSLTSDTPEEFSRTAFAYAQPFEGVHIRIFVDHVLGYAHDSTFLPTYLLAHVMVHEITHLLEGVNRHSREGIMKARWTSSDIEGMVVKPLSFAPEDIQLIHAGLGRYRPPKAKSGVQ